MFNDKGTVHIKLTGIEYVPGTQCSRECMLCFLAMLLFSAIVSYFAIEIVLYRFQVYRLYSLDKKKVMAGIELNKKIARSWHSFPKQMMICLSQAKLLSKNHFLYAMLADS